MASNIYESLHIDLENFSFVTLHQYMSDKRKVSRKKTILNYKQEQLFIPEGHSSCILWEKINEDRDQAGEKSIGIAFIGGVRYTEPSTWELGNSLTVLDCHVSENDVEVKNCILVGADQMIGSSLYSLQGSSMVNFRDTNENTYSIFLWGGVNTKTMSCMSELVKLDIKEQEAKRARSAPANSSKRGINLKVDVSVCKTW